MCQELDFTSSNSNFDGSSLKWVDYNPHADKVYACFWDDSGGGFVMMEMDGPKLEALFKSHQSTAQTTTYASIAAAVAGLGDLNPFTDITHLMPSGWDRTNNNWRMSPTYRVADRLWYDKRRFIRKSTSVQTIMVGLLLILELGLR